MKVKKSAKKGGDTGGNMPFSTIKPWGKGENKPKKIFCEADRTRLVLYTHQTGRALISVIHHSCG
ncbi:hypothetical protein [Erwinia sp. E_sp_B04_7]|uniref:hypothetical protein n=1 Tax=unclassified Erwinia TaxID=2622719 RepID=UPI0030D18DD3